MKTCPVVCMDPKLGAEIAHQLGLAGLPAPVVVLDRSTVVPDGSSFVVVDEAGSDVAAAWAMQVRNRAVLKRTIAYSSSFTARDMTRLDGLKVGYFCRRGRDPSALLRLIALIDAELVMSGEARREEATILAGSIFNSTMGAFGLFESSDSFDGDFFHGLAENFQTSLGNTSLMLLIDEISRNQDTTIQHCSLVTTLTTAFATTLGLPAREVERLFMAGFFHDIGKAAIPKSIMDKPARLTVEETRLMRSHVAVGHDMLMKFEETAGEVAEVALLHHELLDGSGYPHGLRGKEITDLVRIVTICDIFGALIERRSYKEPMKAEQAYEILVGMDAKLDQDLVGVFRDVAESINYTPAPPPAASTDPLPERRRA